MKRALYAQGSTTFDYRVGDPESVHEVLIGWQRIWHNKPGFLLKKEEVVALQKAVFYGSIAMEVKNLYLLEVHPCDHTCDMSGTPHKKGDCGMSLRFCFVDEEKANVDLKKIALYLTQVQTGDKYTTKDRDGETVTIKDFDMVPMH